jgi:hypothetical protein
MCVYLWDGWPVCELLDTLPDPLVSQNIATAILETCIQTNERSCFAYKPTSAAVLCLCCYVLLLERLTAVDPAEAAAAATKCALPAHVMHTQARVFCMDWPCHHHCSNQHPPYALRIWQAMLLKPH